MMRKFSENRNFTSADFIRFPEKEADPLDMIPCLEFLKEGVLKFFKIPEGRSFDQRDSVIANRFGYLNYVGFLLEQTHEELDHEDDEKSKETSDSNNDDGDDDEYQLPSEEEIEEDSISKTTGKKSKANQNIKYQESWMLDSPANSKAYLDEAPSKCSKADSSIPEEAPSRCSEESNERKPAAKKAKVLNNAVPGSITVTVQNFELAENSESEDTYSAFFAP